MGFIDRLIEGAADSCAVQRTHSFGTELADETFVEAAIQYWIEREYRSLHDDARVFALAVSRVLDEEQTSELLGITDDPGKGDGSQSGVGGVNRFALTPANTVPPGGDRRW